MDTFTLEQVKEAIEIRLEKKAKELTARWETRESRLVIFHEINGMHDILQNIKYELVK